MGTTIYRNVVANVSLCSTACVQYPDVHRLRVAYEGESC